MMEENELKENVINIHPLNKGRRMLIFLGDFFLMFIMAFILMGVLVTPIGSKITKIDDQVEEIKKAQDYSLDVLYGYNILFYESDVNKYELNKSLDYTSIRFLSYYVFDEEVPVGVASSFYGHQQVNDVFYNYYINLRDDDITYSNLVSLYDKDYSYFIVDEHNVSLKAEIKEKLKAYYDPKDSLSKQDEKIFNNITQTIFLNLYSSVIEDIKGNDLVFNNISFKEQSEAIAKFDKFYLSFFSFCALISYVLSWGISYLLIPLINKNQKTITMMILKAERIGVNNLYLTRKIDVILSSIYAFAVNMFFVFLLPLSFVSVTYLFALPFVPSLSIIGLVISFVSMFVILFNEHNRSLGDVLSRSVLIHTEELDKMYKLKGFKD